MFAADLIRTLNASDFQQCVVVLRDGDRRVEFAAPTQFLGEDAAGRRYDLRRSRALRRLVRNWHPDLLQVHGSEALTVATIAFPRSPIVYRRIGSSHVALRAGWRRLAYRGLMWRSARVIAVADALRREAQVTFRVPDWKIVTIPNGVDPARLTVRRTWQDVLAALGLPLDSRVLLSVGALTWEKDPMTHLRVGARVLADVPSAVHLLVGDGPMRAQLERDVLERGLGDRIRFLGSRNDVPELMASSDLLLFASRPDGMEGMPGTVIEAAMLGVPVVGFDVAGISEVMDRDRTGVLVPWGDEDGLIDATKRLLTDKQRRLTMGAAAKVDSTARFHIDSIAQRYASLYREVTRRVDRNSPIRAAYTRS